MNGGLHRHLRRERDGDHYLYRMAQHLIESHQESLRAVLHKMGPVAQHFTVPRSTHQNVSSLITSPHEGDIFELTPLHQDFAGRASSISIPLVATEIVKWYSNEVYLGSGKTLTFSPNLSGRYEIVAKNSTGQSETVSIAVEESS